MSEHHQTAMDRLVLLVDIHMDPSSGDAPTKPGDGKRLDRAYDRYCKVHLHRDAAMLPLEQAAVQLARLEASPHKGARTRGAVILQTIKAAQRRHVPTGDGGNRWDREDAVWMVLEKTQMRQPKATASNAGHVFESDSRWVDRLRWNEFAEEVELDGLPVTDVTASTAAIWLSRTYGFDVPRGAVRDALEFVARRDPYHPIKDYLNGLVWDGTPRLETWARTYLRIRVSAIEAHAKLQDAMAWKWLVSAVARAFEPGIFVKAHLLLVGDQNAGKTSALEILGGAWYTRTRLDLSSKDAMAQVIGVWIYEIPEISEMFRTSSAERIKAFIDQSDDRFRSVWDKKVDRHPRAMVFAATDNHHELLSDPTGATRWLPLNVGQIDLDALRRDRDQLWAEAVQAYRRRVPHWLDAKESALHRDYVGAFQAADVLEERIATWLLEQNGEAVRLCDVFAGIGHDVNRADAKLEAKAAAILRRLGFASSRVRSGAKPGTYWRRP